MKYEPADRTVQDLAETIISRDYPDLHELTALESPTHRALKIDFVFVHAEVDEDGEPVGPAIKHQGYAADGLCRIINLRDRAMGRGDVEIQLDFNRWGKMDHDEQEALLAHEIHHIEPKKDRADNTVRDDLGRVKIGLKKHDHQVGWFVAIAKRYGRASGEVQQAKAIFDADGQSLFGFLKLTDQVPEAAESVKLSINGGPEIDATKALEMVDLHTRGQGVRRMSRKQAAETIIAGAKQMFAEGKA